MREDMIRVISEYMEVQEDEIEIQLSRTDGSVSLTANIPVVKMKRDITC
ncbi:MAG: cell division topological specificity factor MinE, partial [Selenomonadales bacterium]|nr:cell division topological specificity factor MinE [Selenomonadales bacterium]